MKCMSSRPWAVSVANSKFSKNLSHSGVHARSVAASGCSTLTGSVGVSGCSTLTGSLRAHLWRLFSQSKARCQFKALPAARGFKDLFMAGAKRMHRWRNRGRGKPRRSTLASHRGKITNNGSCATSTLLYITSLHYITSH